MVGICGEHRYAKSGRAATVQGPLQVTRKPAISMKTMVGGQKERDVLNVRYRGRERADKRKGKGWYERMKIIINGGMEKQNVAEKEDE